MVWLRVRLYTFLIAQGLGVWGQTVPASTPRCPGFANSVVPGACPGLRHGVIVNKGSATYTHSGLDLTSDCGSPIYALADGMVVDLISTETDPDFSRLGYTVRLKHAATGTGLPAGQFPQMRSTVTLYSHMQGPPSVKLGTLVLGHSLLGRVGQAGESQACYVHFEVRFFNGRFANDPSWNGPTAFYGQGDQRANKIFRDSWEDPMSYLARLPKELSASEALALELSMRATTRDLPKMPERYIEPGACPGEYCRYGDVWTIEEEVAVHPFHDSTKTAFVLTKGQKVTTVTGMVTTKPGKIRIVHPIRIDRLLVNEGYLYVLAYRGEGFWKVWLNGKLIDSVQLGSANFVTPQVCDVSDQPCKQRLEDRWVGGPIVGEMEVQPEPHWWVQIRDKAGRTGWIEAPTHTWSSVNSL
jgi:murein DD-endopeptidase MepM/ murein hydrolase activator NlpD